MTQSIRLHRRIALGLLIVGLLFIALGIYRGEVALVLKKSTIICLECIGIG